MIDARVLFLLDALEEPSPEDSVGATVDEAVSEHGESFSVEVLSLLCESNVLR